MAEAPRLRSARGRIVSPGPPWRRSCLLRSSAAPFSGETRQFPANVDACDEIQSLWGIRVSSSSAEYVFGSGGTEQQRLIDQAKALEPQARWLLDRLRIEAGWRVADIGCGPIGILDLLSERVGPKGEVVGIEREQRFAEMAREEIEKRRLSNVSVVQGDALGAGEGSEPFDLVHERLVLLNLPPRDQLTVVEHMAGRLKPGGLIALQEYDAVSLVCYPEHPSWTILLDAYAEAFRSAGGNRATGRRVHSLLRSAGVPSIEMKVHARTLDVGESQRTVVLTLVRLMQERIMALGRFSESEFEEHQKRLLQHLADPDTLVIDRLLIQAWGRKPV
jgi:SAM-dependent methyltransferase